MTINNKLRVFTSFL